MAILALAVDSGGRGVWAAGAGVVCSAIALQDSPGGRVQLVVIVALQMGGAVFVGSLTSAYTVVFLVVIAVWCLGSGMQWALGSHAGLVGAAGSALVIVAPPDVPSVTSVALPTILTIAAGFVQAALIAVWPPQRWRTQSDALAWAYRSLAADARRIAADRDSPAGGGSTDLASGCVRRHPGHQATRGLPRRASAARTVDGGTTRTPWHPGR